MNEPAETVSLYEAKTRLSELGERAASGTEIIVTKHGKPRFRLVPVDVPAHRPAPGSVPVNLKSGERKTLAGHDWFAADEDVERLFGTRE